MKLVRIEVGEVGLVMNRGRLTRIATTGRAWVKGKETIEKHSLRKRFEPNADMDILLQSHTLRSVLDVIEVRDEDVYVVYENGRVADVLTAGRYAFWKGLLKRDFVRQDLAAKVSLNKPIDVLLRNEKIAAMTTEIVVGDAEIGLVFENGLHKSVLISGRYLFWKGLVDYSVKVVDKSQVKIKGEIELEKLNKALIAAYVRVVNVESYEKAILFVDGENEGELPQGATYFWKNDTTITTKRVDIRKQQMEISGQEILTKDKAALRVNFFLQYLVTDIEKALLETADFEKQLYVLAQLALREFVGADTLDGLLEKKNTLGQSILESIQNKAASIGVKVLNSGIRDVILPGDMKEIMNQVLIAQKQAEANTIARREETASTRNLLNTAKLMGENEVLFKLKEMEYMETIAEKISSISISGSGQVLEQLKDIFVAK